MISLAQRMASYGRYHRDRRNRLTHFVGVPLIVFALGFRDDLRREVADRIAKGDFPGGKTDPTAP